MGAPPAARALDGTRQAVVRTPFIPWTALLLATLAAASSPATPAAAQSLLERPPNLDVSWVSTPGTIQFDFLHRFTASGAPERKVINTPTFLLGAGLPGNIMLGFNYATNSDVAPLYPNEWELFGRWRPLSEDAGRPLDASVQAGYNVAGRSFDAAASFARNFGPLRLLVEPRAFSHAYYEDRARAALAGGAVLRLNRWIALAGDVAQLLGSGGGRAAWGAGFQLAIPYTPHTISLQATNTTTGTLEGASRGTATRRYGFAFTIPLTLARWFGRQATASPGAAAHVAATAPDTVPAPAPDTVAAPAASPGDTARQRAVAAAAPADSAAASAASRAAGAPAAPAAPQRAGPQATPARPRSRAAARITVHNLVFVPASLTVAAGGTVTWTNRDPLAHSVTADDGSFDSGLIQPGASWSHTFAKPGRVAYHCTPHPFMHGAAVVQ